MTTDAVVALPVLRSTPSKGSALGRAEGNVGGAHEHWRGQGVAGLDDREFADLGERGHAAILDHLAGQDDETAWRGAVLPIGHIDAGPGRAEQLLQHIAARIERRDQPAGGDDLAAIGRIAGGRGGILDLVDGDLGRCANEGGRACRGHEQREQEQRRANSEQSHVHRLASVGETTVGHSLIRAVTRLTARLPTYCSRAAAIVKVALFVFQTITLLPDIAPSGGGRAANIARCAGSAPRACRPRRCAHAPRPRSCSRGGWCSSDGRSPAPCARA